MTAPIPDGVAPLLVSYKSEIDQIKHGVDEASRRSVTQVSASSPPETTAAATGLLASPWMEFGSGYAGFSYLKIGTRVFLRGLLKPTAATAAGAAAFTLPAGVRPGSAEMFVVMGSNSSGDLAVRIDITTSGVGIVQAAIPANSYLSVSGITFSTL